MYVRLALYKYCLALLSVWCVQIGDMLLTVGGSSLRGTAALMS